MENCCSDQSVEATATDYFQRQQSNHLAVDVSDDELDSESRRRRLAVLRQKLVTPPRILSRSAGRPTCSIFKVPQSFLELNGRHYQPQIVSVGAFHHGKHRLQMIQEHKYQYLSLLLTRTNLTLEDLFQSLESLESQSREAYSEEISLDSHDFLELMVVDGCFIIELFRKVSKLVPIEQDDPVLSVSWIFSFLMRDLLLLENQLPFFVLQRLFHRTRGTSEQEKSESASLADICFRFFSYAIDRPPEVFDILRRFEAKHLLDLYRTSFIPMDLETKSRDRTVARPSRTGHIMPSHVIHCVTKLRKAGIKIRPPRDNDGVSTFLSVRFLRHGVIEMPTVSIDDFMCSFFANCVAYEISQYKKKSYNDLRFSVQMSKYVLQFFVVKAIQVNDCKDVEYLEHQNVIDNYLGTEGEVARFINNIGKDSPFDYENCYLQDVFGDVNRYQQSKYKLHVASFKYTYFRTPWPFVSAVAALILLFLSILQTLYSMLAYHKQQPVTMNDCKDVEYLADQNVIDNYLGTEEEVAGFINNIGKDSPFDYENCYLQDVFEQVNHYHQSSCNVHISSFKYTYFRTPWSFISATAALILLFLSILQTLYTMLPYYQQTPLH
ncbi:hypothetical protein V2J09_009637 [Rumex salicifolius]